MWRNQNFAFRPNYSPNFNCTPWYSMPQPKRKIEIDTIEDELPPAKIYISEEKMVSQLSGIHLSNDFTSHGTCTTKVEDSCINGETLPKLTLCDEIKNIPTTSTQILPRQLLETCRRPTNALVLWQPPSGDLGKILGSIKETKNEDLEDEDEKQPVEESASRDVDMLEDDNNNNNNNDQMGHGFNGFFVRTV